MKSNNSRIDRLKEMITLEEKRAALQQEIDQLTSRLSTLKDQLFTDSPAAAASPAPTGKSRGSSPARTKFAAGSLKDKVLAALEAAGDQGVYVKELAAAIGTKPVNIHSWFHSNLERHPSIEKLIGGHYRLRGAAAPVETAAAEPAPKRAAKASGKKPAKALKAAKAPKAAKADTGSKRGELSASIMAELEASGRKGVTVGDLSEKLGKNYKNIYIWFATTGKKNPKILKIGKAAYRLEE